MTRPRDLVTHLEEIRRTYRPEFKLEAVRQLELNKKSVKQLAHELGITPCLIYQWHKKKLEGKLLLGEPRKVEPHLREIKHLRRALRRVTRERDILKKAVSYFASQPR